MTERVEVAVRVSGPFDGLRDLWPALSVRPVRTDARRPVDGWQVARSRDAVGWGATTWNRAAGRGLRDQRSVRVRPTATTGAPAEAERRAATSAPVVGGTAPA
ncbi:MAG: hypothetical protein K0S70_4675 [Microbacterium sp.]|nr:hypothetical protein [Microbacterium sp.]MDQ1074580.1 hypothetical protein [Microbacterium sp. SORGH_AS_0969]MDQ1114809.1 hypothetical protein [Microbacterium testaceum]